MRLSPISVLKATEVTTLGCMLRKLMVIQVRRFVNLLSWLFLFTFLCLVVHIRSNGRAIQCGIVAYLYQYIPSVFCRNTYILNKVTRTRKDEICLWLGTECKSALNNVNQSLVNWIRMSCTQWPPGQDHKGLKRPHATLLTFEEPS